MAHIHYWIIALGTAKMAGTTRKSLLDVVEKNLKIINYSTYVTRFSYFGEYFHSSEEFQEVMRRIVKGLHGNLNENLVTGLLLIYPRFYIHLLEGPEDVIYMHVKGICENKNGEGKFGKAIVLPTYHHVNHRFFIDWFHVYTLAPSLLERIEKQTLEDIKRQISNCCMKLYHLCDYISRVMRDGANDAVEILYHLNEKVPQYLPESTVLEFLLNAKSSVLKTVEDYLRVYTEVPFIEFYDESRNPRFRQYGSSSTVPRRYSYSNESFHFNHIELIHESYSICEKYDSWSCHYVVRDRRNKNKHFGLASRHVLAVTYKLASYVGQYASLWRVGEMRRSRKRRRSNEEENIDLRNVQFDDIIERVLFSIMLVISRRET